MRLPGDAMRLPGDAWHRPYYNGRCLASPLL
jgi:hypothetical protein